MKSYFGENGRVTAVFSLLEGLGLSFVEPEGFCVQEIKEKPGCHTRLTWQ